MSTMEGPRNQSGKQSWFQLPGGPPPPAGGQSSADPGSGQIWMKLPVRGFWRAESLEGKSLGGGSCDMEARCCDIAAEAPSEAPTRAGVAELGTGG